MNLPPDILTLHAAFAKRGKKLYIVGGAVRDYVLNKTPKDYDLATDALPEEVVQIGKQLGFPIVEVGKSFGVVILGDYEIATFRSDIGSGRRPESVSFTTIENDVKRRDLTINALFYDIGKKKIVDLVGGLSDLADKTIRTVGNPQERFAEDPLRKLRAIRFVGNLGGTLDLETLNAIKKNPDLDGISAERIRDEFIKGINKAKSVSRFLQLLDSVGILEEIFPGIRVNRSFFPEESNYTTVIAILLRSDPNRIEVKLNALKYTIPEVRKIKFLISLYNFKVEDLLYLKKLQAISDISEKEVKRFAQLCRFRADKFLKFTPSVTISQVPLNLKGKQIGDWILQREIAIFSQLT